MKNITPFPWYGSKFTQVSWVTSLLPETERYVEPFGGSGVVMLNREPSDVETFNDLNSGVVNFFDVIREKREEFLEALSYTPHSREMFERASNTEVKDDNVKEALYFLISVAQAFGGVEGRSWARSIGTSRRGMAQRSASWDYRKEVIEKVADRMMRVQIENTDALKLIEDHDHPECTFYCDPPYPPESRNDTDSYKHEFDAEQHRELFEVVDACEGNVAVSGYNSSLNEELYSDWEMHTEGEKTLAGSGTGSREEVMWTNYTV
jgi:DNA adenine methylase